MTQPRWHVLGAGAMGCLFAAGLRDAGCHVTLVMREQALPILEFELESDRGKRVLSLPVCNAESGGTVSHLLVTTKAYDVAPAVVSMAHRLAATSRVLVMANGMGYAEEIAATCPGIDPYLGTTTEGAYRSGLRHIHHAGRGSTVIGRRGEEVAPSWFEPWQRVTADCRWEKAIDAALWRKLAINCAINPLTAQQGCRNGELLDRQHLRGQLGALCQEIAQVSEAAGYSSAAGDLRDAVEEVVRGTAANYSSMHQDLHNGRRTEIDYITGYLLRVARHHGIEAPLNRALLEDIKGLESGA